MNYKIAILAMSLAASALSQDSIQTVCGPQTEFEDVESFTGNVAFSAAFVASHSPAVGGLVHVAMNGEISRIFCSGTLISENRFLTARHCISGDVAAMAVTFGYQRHRSGTGPAAQTYRLNRILELGSRWDYAIVEVSGNPGATWGWSKIATSRVAPLPQQGLILQHPSGEYKKAASGEVFRRVGSLLYHRIDTEGASSGAPLFTNDGLVAAVHTSGLCDADAGSYNMAVELAAVTDSNYLGR